MSPAPGGAPTPPAGVLAHVLERIRRFGPIGFADYVVLALYHPDAGFFAAGGAAGRKGDFLTSPELGHLFAAVVGRALDRWWDELGRPDPFTVVEAGAGAGTLARDVIASGPRCAPALRYVLVERSAALRARQAELIALEPPGTVLGPVLAGEGGDEDDGHPLPASGPVATSLAELPAQPVRGVVLANELLDDLAPMLLERRSPAWLEVRVGEEEGGLTEVLVPAAPALAAEAARLAPEAPDGGRIPVQHAVRAWLRQALAVVERGRVVVLDYADDTPSMARRPWRQWLRTYRAHGPGGHPLEHPGSQDVTCEVAVDQLSRVRPPSSDRSQADFLRDHGLDELEASARTAWQERAHLGDLEALRHRSRLGEAAALRDPSGLGAFRVLEWGVA